MTLVETPAQSGAQQPSRRPSAIGALGTGVAALCAIVVFFGLFAFVLSGVQEQRAQHIAYAQLRGLFDPSSPVAPPIGGRIAPGTPVAVLSMPSIGVDRAVILEGTSSGVLLSGPGHLRDSPLPGQVGDSIVMGKGVTAGAPFARIDQLAKGASVLVTTGQGAFSFRVLDVRTAGTRIPDLPASQSMLTLVTATAPDLLSRIVDPHLVYVDAALQGTAQFAPPGRPLHVTAAEIQGAIQRSAWVAVLVFALLLLLAGVLAVWLWWRWGRWQTWVVMTPVLLAILWGLSDSGMRLLPNVY